MRSLRDSGPSTALTIAAELSLVCTPLPFPPEASRIDELNAQNETTLNAILLLDGAIVEHDGDADEKEHGLRRLESKVDLMLEVLGELVRHLAQRPPAASVRLGSETLQWVVSAGAPAPAKGQLLECRLYLHDNYPRPLVMHGSVEDLQRQEGGVTVTLCWRHQGDTVQTLLEKLVFRRHRRSVARQRQLQGAGGKH